MMRTTCKNCKYLGKFFYMPYCKKFMTATDLNFYCGYYERRDT